MRFVKMHGIGNDYVYVNAFAERVPTDDEPAMAALAQAMADRHTGVGGDGLIVLMPSAVDGVPLRMRMWNADGSESEMCGNGLRCVAKLARDAGIVTADAVRYPIETGAGVLTVDVSPATGPVEYVCVDMGAPRLTNREIPNTGPADERTIDWGLDVDGAPHTITTVSMGNPHAVVFVDSVDTAPVHTLGPRIENHPFFPRRTNVEFVEVVSPTCVRQRTWERGSGETLACGTGACAVVVAGTLTGRLACVPGQPVTVKLLGGDLEIEWDRDGSNHVFKTGPAVTVFAGEWPG